MMKHFTTLLAVVAIAATGCASQREIATSPPRPREDTNGAGIETARQARLVVALQKGRTQMPAEVSSLRFRVADIQLHAQGGAWTRLPSDAGTIDFDRGARHVGKTVLDTRIPPARYDSLAISFERVFVEFNENAGAPLTTADGVPQRLALTLELERSVATSLTLNLEPGPSLTRSPDCSWFFIPVLRPEIEQGGASVEEASQR